MGNANELRVVGLGASPYTRKLRAALRFRRLPFRFVVAGSKEAQALPDSPLPLIPYLIEPDADGNPSRAKSDTTPILTYLDYAYPERRLRPSDPALHLLDLLIEDFGDEWLSKCMFHYRWSKVVDARCAGDYLPFSMNMQMTSEDSAAASAMFSKRQISRLRVVGINATTAPVIEASWRRFLHLFDVHIQNSPYFLGNRPGAGDFGCFGQMAMLVMNDPTPVALSRSISPRAYAWTERCEDLSGLDVSDADWMDISAMPDTLRNILSEIGRVYAPYLLANAVAVQQGNATFQCELDGEAWEQDAFAYQAKCLVWLRDAYAALSKADATRVDSILKDTGCEVLFSGL